MAGIQLKNMKLYLHQKKFTGTCHLFCNDEILVADKCVKEYFFLSNMVEMCHHQS